VVASTRSAAAGKARVLVGSDTSLLLGDQTPPGATAGLRPPSSGGSSRSPSPWTTGRPA
jgi:hypothetical protein